MNRYLYVVDGTIRNIVVASSDVAKSIGLFPDYDGAYLGSAYTPPEEKNELDRIEALETENSLLKAQLRAQTERSDFIEDCIAEMATQVYAQ